MKITLTSADTGQPIEINTEDVTSRGSSWHNGKDTNCITLKDSAENVWIVEDYSEVEKKFKES